MSLRIKALAVLVAFALVVAGACGMRAYSEAKAAADAKAAAAAEERDAGGFEITDLDEKAVYLLGGDDAAAVLAAKVADWCEENVAEARKATWDRTAKCDFAAGSVELGLVLDDEKATKVKVRAFPDTGRYVVEKAVDDA